MREEGRRSRFLVTVTGPESVTDRVLVASKVRSCKIKILMLYFGLCKGRSNKRSFRRWFEFTIRIGDLNSVINAKLRDADDCFGLCNGRRLCCFRGTTRTVLHAG